MNDLDTPPAAQAGARDFDFFLGHWTVRHHRLRERLAGCDTWDDFGGHCRVQPLMGGQGNLDDNLLDLPGGAYRAATLRAFDPATGHWAIWWLDARHPHHLDTPMIGRFDEQGTGLFYADDTLAGRPIRVRFRWLNTRSGAPRWEQAFSPDGGQTWEVNWVMDFAPGSAWPSLQKSQSPSNDVAV